MWTGCRSYIRAWRILTLYPYQKRGVLFAALRQRSIIADDMGLGKTIQAIGAAMLLRERRGITSCLIVCPASLKHQWRREIGRACEAGVVVIEGGRRARRELYRSDEFFKIVNYELVMRDDHEVLLPGTTNENESFLVR